MLCTTAIVLLAACLMRALPSSMGSAFMVPDGVYTSPMHETMAVYMKQHSIHTLLTENNEKICARRFVVGKINCNGMGNGNHQFIDNLLWAAVFNRTFVAHMVGWDSCKDSIAAKHWIVNDSMLIHITGRSGCPISIDEQKKIFSSGNTQIPLSAKSLTDSGIKLIRCCAGLEQSMRDMRIMSPGMWPMQIGWRLTYETFYRNNESADIWSEEVRRRFHNLTNLESHPHDKARGFATTGHLAIMSLRFSDSVRELAKDTLSSVYDLPADFFLNSVDDDGDDLYNYSDLRLRWPARKIIFGYHGRHQFEDLNREQKVDNRTIECLFRDILSVVEAAKIEQVRQNCTILLAADRPHTIESVGVVAKRQGCSVRFIDRQFAAEQKNEHGPWAQPHMELSKADTYLVSHAQYFIGGSSSTFSMFIASYVAARNEIDHYLNAAAATSVDINLRSSDGTANTSATNSGVMHTVDHIWSVSDATGKCSRFIDQTITRKCQNAVVFKEGQCIAAKD